MLSREDRRAGALKAMNEALAKPPSEWIDEPQEAGPVRSRARLAWLEVYWWYRRQLWKTRGIIQRLRYKLAAFIIGQDFYL